MNILRNKALECHVQVGDSYFTNTENKIIYRGSLQDFYWKKGTHESIDFYVHISMSKEKKMRQYFSNILIYYTHSDCNKEKIDYWLDDFKKFHQQYIVIPTESYNSSITEDIRYIAVRTPPGFINKKNKYIYYFNATIQLLYCNIIFRKLILNIDCYTMMSCLDKNNKHFAYHYQKIMIVKELQKILVICI